MSISVWLKTAKRYLAMLLALSLILGLVPVYALESAEGTSDLEVTNGDNLDNEEEELGNSYHTTRETGDWLSLHVTGTTDGDTYYFSDLSELSEASKAIGTNITLTVLESNDTEYTFSESTTWFASVANLTIDLNGQTLKLSGAGKTVLTIAATESVTLCDGAYTDNTAKGQIILNGVGLTIRALKEIKDISIEQKNLSTLYAIATSTTGSVTISNSAFSGENGGATGVLFKATATKGKVDISNSTFYLNGLGRAIQIMDTSNIINCNIQADNGTGIYMNGSNSADATLSIKGGEYSASTLINNTRGKKDIILDGGKFSGTLSNTQSTSLIEIEGGYFSEAAKNCVDGTKIVANHGAFQYHDSGYYEGYYEFIKHASVTATVSKTGITEAAEITCESGTQAYQTEDYICVVRLLPGYEVSEIVLSGEKQALEETGDGYGYSVSEDGITGTYKIQAPDTDFSIQFTISEKETNETEASIGETSYQSLSAALLAIQEGETLKLEKDIVYPTALVLTNKNITLDLNGKKLTIQAKNETSYGIGVNGGSLTIQDSTEDQAGIISFDTKSQGIYVEGSGTNFELKSGTLQDIASTAGAGSYTLYSNGGQQTVKISGGHIIGRVYNVATTEDSTLTISGGLIEAYGSLCTAVEHGGVGKLIMTGGEIKSDLGSCPEGYGALVMNTGMSAGANVIAEISGGKITAKGQVVSGTNIRNVAGLYYFHGLMYGGTELTNVEISSEQGAAVSIGGFDTTLSMQLNLKIGVGVKLKGGTNALEINEGTLMPSISVVDGSFACGEGYLPISDTYFVTYPSGKVLNTVTNSEGYYTLVETSALEGTNEQTGEQYQYQDYEGKNPGSGLGSGLDAILEEAKPIYETNNSEGYPEDDLWAPFAAAYQAAVRVRYKEGDASTNPRANQNEIDYRAAALTQTMQALKNYTVIDLNKLADGDYSIGLTAYKYNMSGTSMASGAFSREATLRVRDGVAYLDTNLQPMFAMDVWGHLLHLWTFEGDTPAEMKANWNDYKNEYSGKAGLDKRVEATYSGWYAHTAGNDVTTATSKGEKDEQSVNYPYPGTATIRLPYRGTSLEESTLYCRVDVDAMAFGSTAEGAGHANLLLVLAWGTLTPKEDTIKDTLYLSKTALTLGTNATSEPIEVEVLNGTGYMLTVSPTADDSSALATATLTDGTLTITTGEKTGNQTITVTATKEGAETLTKTIAVKVTNGKDISAATTTNGTTATATLSGDELIKGGDNVDAAGSTVTVDAKSGNGDSITTAQVVIPPTVATALEGKTLALETDVGTIKLDSTIVAQIAKESGDVTLSIQEVFPNRTGVNADFYSAYEISLTQNGKAVSFNNGTATITVPCANTSVKYAYYVNGAKLDEKVSVTLENGNATWRTNHFSLWALSSRSYQIGETEILPDITEEYFLEDGYYYVTIYLYKENEKESSMGDVAFKNNRKALVRVQNGEVTTVQVATNPVDVSASNVTYHSGITSVKIPGATVTYKSTGSLTTKPANKDYTYVKTFSFTMPSSLQPAYSNEETFVPLQFVVPDTPMDSIVLGSGNAQLEAKLLFQWSTATSTSDTKLVSNDKTASGTSDLTGEIVTDVELVDRNTGIELSTTTAGLSDKAVLSVTKPTSGSDYDTAVKAMGATSDPWTLYKIVATVSGKETAPDGSVTLSIPCGSQGLTVYRINSNGTRTTIKGSVKNGYYVFSTSSLGLFAVIGQVNEITLLEDLTDKDTGIRLTSTQDVLPNGATLKVTAVTSGADYTAAQNGLEGQVNKLAVYTIAARTSAGRDTQPTGSFTLSFPIPTDYATNRMAVYRLENGKVTELAGTISASGKTYTLETDKLGTFVVAERVSSVLDRFTDLNGHWARDYIAVAVERGLFAGVSDTTFGPDQSMTRGMFVTVLGRLAGADTTSTATPFTDVKDGDYYAPYVAWAAQNGIVQGTTPTTFEPDRAVSREEMATLLNRYCQFAKITLDSSLTVTFTDQDTISEYAREAVQAMASAGLLVGTDNGAFAPKGTATRAEVATLLARFVKNNSL